MKINEKNLSAFALSATPVDREGFLFKKGEVNKGYQKRWFVLKGNLLFYFEKQGDKEPVGVVILEGCTIELAEDEEQYGFKIVFHGTGNRSYVVGAESQESMEQWMKALACASYDYMKLMVAELQRQLDEMEESELLAASLAQSAVTSTPSPLPPPRQRQNPFNRSAPDGSFGARSLSVRSAPGRPENVRPARPFRELHTTYGRRVLADLAAWRHAKRRKEQPLVQL